MQKTESYEKITVIRVEFSEDEFNLLLMKVGDHQAGAEAQYIHDVVMRSLRRKRRQGKGVQT